jgi:hypothetical protein
MLCELLLFLALFFRSTGSFTCLKPPAGQFFYAQNLPEMAIFPILVSWLKNPN